MWAPRVSNLRRDVKALEALESRLPNVETLAAQVLLDTQLQDQDKSVLETHAQELLILARMRIQKKQNYVNLFFLLISCLFYCMAISSQRDLTAYDIESRYASAHVRSLACLLHSVGRSDPDLTCFIRGAPASS